MAKVITFSRKFLKGHPRAGEPTYFVEKVLNALKIPFRGISYYSELERLNAGNPKITPRILEEFFISLDWEDNITGEKIHTIRSGHRWKQGEMASIRVWSGIPYHSPQIIFAPDTEVVKVYYYEMNPNVFWDESRYFVKGIEITDKDKFSKLSQNDGLSPVDFALWFAGKNAMDTKRKPFDGQIICWKDPKY